jgi:ubiquinone/menaquinone biosynthesis C-methylase UbiE
MDSWASGEKYEPYVGRWSRPVARDFVAWLDLPADLRWLDVGCGTGALTDAVLAGAAPERVLGLDPSAGFVGYAAAHVSDPGASFGLGDARALPVRDGSVDAVVSGLMLNFVPDRAAALGEMCRVLRPGGLVAAYVWDYPGEMQLMRWFWDAAVDVDPAARLVDESIRFGFCRPEPLRSMLERAGFDDVRVEALTVPTVFRDFDDYWTPFLGGQGSAPSYVSTLDEPARATLHDALRARVPTEDDGSIRLTARAWAVRGARE